MITLIKIYNEHHKDVEQFIVDNVENNGVLALDKENLDIFFKTLDSLQMLFVSDKNYLQTSPSLFRKSEDISRVGFNRSALIKDKNFDENGYYFSRPYICSITGHTIITVIKQLNEHYLVMDFNIEDLLEELEFLTHAQFFTKSNKLIYGFIGYGLTLLSLILIFYSFYSFNAYFFHNESLIETTFKAIISLTLGLAVFDLGKNLLEHEVVFPDNNPNEKSDSKMFIKFLISIITALSIEALMLVLKISLTKEYSDLLYAIYLIAGISLMIATLALFYKMSKKTT